MKEVYDMVKLLVRLGTLLLSLLFWIAAKLRLTLPLLYILVMGISTIFSDFVRRNEKSVLWGMYFLLGLSILSWLCTLAQTVRERRQTRFTEEDIAWQLRRAREQGVGVDTVRFSGGMLRDARTGTPIDQGAGQ